MPEINFGDVDGDYVLLIYLFYSIL